VGTTATTTKPGEKRRQIAIIVIRLVLRELRLDVCSPFKLTFAFQFVCMTTTECVEGGGCCRRVSEVGVTRTVLRMVKSETERRPDDGWSVIRN
jgi:hypothetical protein